MRKTEKSPKKREIPFAVAMAEWPEWMPRPAIPQHAPETALPAPSADEEIRFESELPSVAEVRAQTVRAPAARKSRPSDDDDDRVDSIAAQVKLITMIGKRMREAREQLAGFSQVEAATLLGYSNSSKLAKIEGATDTRSVPLLTILRAAELYQVSVDFLFGASDDWERDPGIARERHMARWLHEHLEQARTRDALAFAQLQNKVDSVSSLIPKLANAGEQALSSFSRLLDMNPCYEDLIGGAKLQAALEALDEAGRKAKLALKRLHVELAGQVLANKEMEGAQK